MVFIQLSWKNYILTYIHDIAPVFFGFTKITMFVLFYKQDNALLFIVKADTIVVHICITNVFNLKAAKILRMWQILKMWK